MTEATLRIKVDSSEVKTADKSLADLSRTSKTADGQTKQLTQTTERLSGAAKAAATAFAALGVSLSVREIIQANDAWVSATNQLRLVTTGTENLAATQRSLLSVANETRSSFESTANLYARLARATSEMGLSQTDLLGITETINQSFAVSGATASEAAAAITQLSQGLAAGALRGDEFNSVAEQAPGIMRAIADSLNLTVGELRAFAAEGGITAEIVVNALQQASASIESDFSKATATLGQSIQIAKNNFTAFAGQSDAVSDGVSALGSVIVMASEGLDELGDATDYAYRMAVDFAAVMGESVSPVLQDIEFFVLALRDGFAEFGGTVVSTGSTVQTGIAQLDEIVNAFFDNFSTGAVSAAEMFSLAFGTAVPNAVAVVQTGTVAIADLFERMKVRITKAGEEEAAALAALDAIRARSVSEIMSARDEELVQLYELIKGQADARKSVSELVEGQEELAVAIDDTSSSTRDSRRETKDNTEEVDKARKKAEQYVQTLEQQLNATQMTSRAAAIYEAVMKASAESTGLAKAEADKFIVSAATLAAKLYDVEEAQRAAEQSAKDLQKANDEAAKVAADAWGRTHESLSDIFVDVFDKGGSAFEKVGDMAVATAKRIAAEWLALKAMDLFGISMPSGAGGGGAGSILGSVAKSAAGNAVGSLISGGSSTAAAIAAGGKLGGLGASVAGGTTAGGVGAAAAGGGGMLASIGGAVSSAGSAIMGGLSAIPGWGWALGGAALLASQLSKDETPSSNAGFLIRPVADDRGRTFDVPAFASGFDPVGFARREDQGAAVAVIDTFRQYDAALTQIASAAGISVNYDSNNFGGFSEKGTGGGLFFGSAAEDGRNTAAPIEQQVNQFVGQWIKGLSGQVDQSLINDVLSAGSADEMVKRAAKLAGVDGSHASGLDFVPFDGYRAELHRGERVQTASEARNMESLVPVMAQLLQVMNSIARDSADSKVYNRRSYEILDRWQGEGFPVTA